MRKMTQKEAEEWTELVRKEGFGRLKLESQDDRKLTLKLITPLIAEPYSNQNLKRKHSPIMFDRTQNGEIIIPGRWWVDMTERLSEDAILESDRESLLQLSRMMDCQDTLLTPDTDTIEFPSVCF